MCKEAFGPLIVFSTLTHKVYVGGLKLVVVSRDQHRPSPRHTKGFLGQKGIFGSSCDSTMRFQTLCQSMCSERKPILSGNTTSSSFFLYCSSLHSYGAIWRVKPWLCVDTGLSPMTVASDFMLCINSLKKLNSLVTVVMEAVVAAQRCQGTKSDSIGEKNLSAGINPDLP